MDRREFVAAATTGLAGAALLPAPAVAETPKCTCLTAHNMAKDMQRLFRVRGEMREHLEAFRVRHEAAAPGLSGTAVPFATLPLNMYVRNPGVQLVADFPAYRWLTSPDAETQGDLAGVLTELLYMRIPAHRIHRRFIMRTAHIDGKPLRATRIISPRFTFDTVEAEHDGSLNARVARILVEMYVGIAAEINEKLADYAKKGGTDHIVVEPVKLWVEQKAFMLDTFAYTHIMDARLCSPDEMELKACALPIQS